MPSTPNLRGANIPDKDVCYVEASMFEKDKSFDSKHTPDTVWKVVKPPTHLGGSNPPLVGARRLEIVRALLTGKVKIRDETHLAVETTEIYSTTKITRRTKF